MTQIMGVREQLSKFNIAFKANPATTGRRTQYLIQPEKIYLDAENAEDSKLRKFTIGTKDPEKPNKSVLLIGETGAGKSTLIDAMLNHVMGTPYESKEWCTIVDPTEPTETTCSQTEKITVYEICAFHNEKFPYSLTIVDTPGFGDTRGVVRDLQLPGILQMLFTDEVTEIAAVALVLKESTNRLDDRQKYIFNSAVSLFGKNIENNIVALITHSGGMPNDTPLKALAKAGIKVATNEKKKPICFQFQNSQTEVEDEDTAFAMQFAWSVSNKGMKGFFDFLKNVESQDMAQSAAVLRKRMKLGAHAESFSDRINVINLQQRGINQTKEALKQLESGQQVTKTIEEPYKDLSESDSWWTKVARCTTCQENCHRECNCWFYCKVVGTNCTSCKGKCQKSYHVRDKQYYVTRTKKVTVPDVEKQFEIKGKEGELKRELEKKEEELARAKEKEVDEVYQCIVELDGIALKGNSVYTYKHLDFLIENLQKLGVERNNEKIQKLTEMKTRIENEEGDGIRYMLASLGSKALNMGQQAAGFFKGLFGKK